MLKTRAEFSVVHLLARRACGASEKDILRNLTRLGGPPLLPFSPFLFLLPGKQTQWWEHHSHVGSQSDLEDGSHWPRGCNRVKEPSTW